MLDIVCKAEDELFTTLTDEQKDLYRKFNEKEMQLHCEEEEDALLYGFRYAVSLINQLNKIDIGEDND
ncbi:MAG: hypothetical protein SO085_03150 [Eubacteriales bacterium]|nr:hypothetical protein [Eubacteriales bacterium]